MQCNFLFRAHQYANVDLDEKLPFTKAFFPKSKIEKRNYAQDNCVIVKNIIEDIKLKSIKDQKCETKIEVDFYTYRLFGLSIMNFKFQVSKDMANKLLNHLKPANLLLHSTMVMDQKEQSISNLFNTIFIKYFQVEKLMEIESKEKYLIFTRQTGQQLRENLKKELYCDYFHTTYEPVGGITGGPGAVLINDDKNEITMDDHWKDIGVNQNTIYQNKINGNVLLLKKNNYLDELREAIIEMSRQDTLLSAGAELCQGWMSHLNSELYEIRRNISDDNENKYYWRELKKNIEIMDLNFLEFHTTISAHGGLMGKFPDTTELDFSKEYIDEYKENKRKARISVFQLLNEVKYAINNLSTPGHTHDEHLLQAETEKVHERLLMISFIAMAIPSGVAIMTPDISIIIKVIAAATIFSIPLIYFSFRKVQKYLSYKRNMKNDFKRQIKIEAENIRMNKEQNEQLKSMDELPEDIKEGIVDLNKQGIDAQEKRLNMLKTKL